MKDVTEVNEADGKTLCRGITPIPENLTVHAWDMSTHGICLCRWDMDIIHVHL